jgi:hypothetical protein
MNRVCTAVGVAAVLVAVPSLAGAAGGVSAVTAFYESGRRAKPPYVFVTVAHRRVDRVRWNVRVFCDDGNSAYTPGATKLNAAVTHGRFAKSVVIMVADSPLGPSEDFITVKGTMSRHRVTVTVIASDVTTLATCDGRHTFKAIRTERFH